MALMGYFDSIEITYLRYLDGVAMVGSHHLILRHFRAKSVLVWQSGVGVMVMMQDHKYITINEAL